MEQEIDHEETEVAQEGELFCYPRRCLLLERVCMLFKLVGARLRDKLLL